MTFSDYNLSYELGLPVFSDNFDNDNLNPSFWTSTNGCQTGVSNVDERDGIMNITTIGDCSGGMTALVFTKVLNTTYNWTINFRSLFNAIAGASPGTCRFNFCNTTTDTNPASGCPGTGIVACSSTDVPQNQLCNGNFLFTLNNSNQNIANNWSFYNGTRYIDSVLTSNKYLYVNCQGMDGGESGRWKIDNFAIFNTKENGSKSVNFSLDNKTDLISIMLNITGNGYPNYIDNLLLKNGSHILAVFPVTFRIG